MIYTLTGNDAAKIDFGATGASEVLQNVRTILATPVFSVPLDRAFGVDCALLDNPMPMAQAKLSAQIFAAIRAYEPRVEVIQVDYVQSTTDALDGRLVPRVQVEVNL